MSDRTVWYAAFGSNLLRERFVTYLTGGPVPYSTGRVQAGARDRRPPSAERTVEIDRRLYFAGSSPGWGHGGVAFIGGPTVDERSALVRLWRITWSQFEDVFAQENASTAPLAIDCEAVTAAGGLDLLPSRFGRVAPLGPGPDGAPMVTVTAPSDAALPSRPADRSYLRVVGLGLMQAFGLTAPAAADYLATADGNAGQIDPVELAADLHRLHR